MKFVYGCVLVLYSVILAQGYPDKTESVKVDFELLLNKCKGSSCHTDRAAQGEAYITLEPEDPTFSWGYTSMEEEDVGVVVYQLRFHVSRISKGKIPVRKLVIGLSGRIGTLSGRQVTWSEKVQRQGLGCIQDGEYFGCPVFRRRGDDYTNASRSADQHLSLIT